MIQKVINEFFRYCGLSIFIRRTMPYGIDPWNDVKRLSQSQPVRIAFDVGANTGQTAKTFSRLFPKAKIHSFEPMPETFEALKKNTRSLSRVKAHNIALGEKKEIKKMYIYKANSAINSFVPDAPYSVNFPKPSTTADMEVITIDSFVKTNNIEKIDLLKIDTEGFDIQVLRGAENLFRKRAVRFVYSEFNEILKTQDSTGGVFLELYEFLTKYDFRLVAIYTDYIKPHKNYFSVRNALFIRNSPFFKKSALFGGILSNPSRFIKWTGCLPYKPVPFKKFNPVPCYEPSIFSVSRPDCAAYGMPWSTTKPIDTVMGHTIVVKNGLANCLGYVFDKKGQLIDGGTHKHREGRKYQRWIKKTHLIRPHSTFPEMRYYGGNVAILTSSTQRFYFHWLLEVLPRLGMIENAQEKIDCIYIEKKRGFQIETLEILGIEEYRIINATDVAVLTAKKIIVPCHQIMNGREYPPWVIKYLRDRFLPILSEKDIPGPRRIFISRENSDHRRLKNEKEIVSNLKDYGFVSVKAEELSFREQIQLFHEAEIVVAPHGSGLANIVFCSPGTTIMELFPACNIDLYFRLSMSLGLKYFYLKDSNGDPYRLNLDDYHIEWENVKKTLSLALS